jgi:hypothetical protein
MIDDLLGADGEGNLSSSSRTIAHTHRCCTHNHLQQQGSKYWCSRIIQAHDVVAVGQSQSRPTAPAAFQQAAVEQAQPSAAITQVDAAAAAPEIGGGEHEAIAASRYYILCTDLVFRVPVLLCRGCLCICVECGCTTILDPDSWMISLLGTAAQNCYSIPAAPEIYV